MQGQALARPALILGASHGKTAPKPSFGEISGSSCVWISLLCRFRNILYYEEEYAKYNITTRSEGIHAGFTIVKY